MNYFFSSDFTPSPWLNKNHNGDMRGSKKLLSIMVYLVTKLFFLDYPPSPWLSNTHNGDMRGSRSPYDSSQSFMSYSDGPNRGGTGIHCVHMRGLPFKATQSDIADVSGFL